CWYYVFVGLDLFGKACWTARLSTHTFSDYRYQLGLTIAEIIRRTLWVMIRVEAQYYRKESLANKQEETRLRQQEQKEQRETRLFRQQAYLSRLQEQLPQLEAHTGRQRDENYEDKSSSENCLSTSRARGICKMNYESSTGSSGVTRFLDSRHFNLRELDRCFKTI
ncbi:hypothetical protein MKX03_008422, partial [Papaver bracteatum]